MTIKPDDDVSAAMSGIFKAAFKIGMETIKDKPKRDSITSPSGTWPPNTR